MKRLSMLLLILAGYSEASAQVATAENHEPRQIIVAAYEFPPYYSSRVNTHILGELVNTLNQAQSNFEFSIREIRPHDRYIALSEQGCCDVLFFESPDWGWQRHPEVLVGPILNEGTERLYAKRERVEREEVYFTVDGRLKIGGVLGYHYQFANFSTEREVLELDFNVYSADSQLSLLSMLVNERLDLAVLTDEFVHWLQLRDHADAKVVEPNTVVDHVYSTRLLMSPDMNPFEQQLLALLNELHEADKFASIFREFGIENSYRFTPNTN
ncbi:MAG: periplasmic protein [Idiomarinaceae bacterium HL-53]|nr:MAG: periplasmic protein [Idiomarinaceae bacterium HL-53]CUS47498.1 hypothetical protein Ga0003345_0425 [Idiomarinaceae bacterium HL-53]